MVAQMLSDGHPVQSWSSIPLEANDVAAPIQAWTGSYGLISSLPTTWWPQSIEVLLPPGEDILEYWRKAREKGSGYALHTNREHIPIRESKEVTLESPQVLYHVTAGSKFVFGRGTKVWAGKKWTQSPTEGWSKARTIAGNEAGDLLKTEKGMLFINSFFPYVRPSASRPTTIEGLPEGSTLTEVTDALGRRWKRTSWQLFGEAAFDAYCLPQPQGVVCQYQFVPTFQPSLVQLLRRNHVFGALSEYILGPNHWRLDALLNYQNEIGFDQNPVLTDFAIKLDPRNRLTVDLRRLGLRVRFKKPIQPHWTFLPISGLTKTSNDTLEWMALGFELVRERAGQIEACAFLAEDISAPWYDTILQEKRAYAMSEPSERKKWKPTHWSRRFKARGRKLELRGACHSLDRIPGETYLASLGKLKPQAFSVEAAPP